MKNLVIIVLFVLSCLVTVLAQEKKDNQINISSVNIDSANKFIMNTLAAKGYRIITAENNIIAASKKCPKLNAYATIQFYIDTLIIINGSVEVPGTSQSEIKYYGMKGSPLLESWIMMNDLAILITDRFNATRTYTKN